MYAPFCFIDEVGLNVGDPTQPFMAIGLLLIENDNLLNDRLHQLHYGFGGDNLVSRRQLIKSLIENSKSLKIHELNNIFLPSRHTEFKFENLGYPNLNKYKQIVNLVFTYKVQFHCIIVDKKRNDFDIEKYGSYWHAYTKFTKLLIKRTMEHYKKIQIIPILDYLHHPKSQDSITKSLNQSDFVVNSLQADSKCHLLLQVVDILLGAVIFEKKKELGIIQTNSKKSLCRSEFTNYLCQKLGREQITSGSTFKPTVFNIWDFKPKK